MKKIWFLLKFFEPKRCKIWNVMKWCVIFTVFLSFSVSAEIAAATRESEFESFQS